MSGFDKFSGVPIKPATGETYIYQPPKTALPPADFIGTDYGHGDMSVASYGCAGCDRKYSFTSRPDPLPLVFACDCGNTITVDDPILRALPKADA